MNTLSVLPGSLAPVNGATASRRIDVKSNASLSFVNKTRFWRGQLKAALTKIEPDLNEDPVDRWETPGITEDEFVHGKYDGHHTYFEGDNDVKGTFWELIAKDFEDVGTPKGFQGLISWLFLPCVAACLYFGVQQEYMFIGAGVYALVFCIIEMNKQDQPHNFEPQIYNMERGARDKLIKDYNKMSIWDFNAKYGDLWDFTDKRDDITKR